MRARVWMATLACGAAALVVHFAILEPGSPRSMSRGGVALVAAVAMVAGALLHRAGARLPWLLLAIALAAFAASDVFGNGLEPSKGAMRPGSFDHVLSLAAYPALFGAVATLARRRDPARDRGALIDTVLMTTAAWVLVWQFLVFPSFRADGLPAFQAAAALADPMMDVLLVGFVARLAWAPGTRVPSYWLLLGGLLTILVADVAFATFVEGVGYAIGGWFDGLWLGAFVLLALAALHPSMAALSDPAPRTDVRLGAERVMLLGASLLVVPFVVLVEESRGEHADLTLVLVASVLIAGLVLTRLVWLVRDRERTREALRLSEDRFRRLVQNAADAIAVFDPDSTFSFVSPAVERLLGYRPDSLVGTNTLELIHPDDREAFETVIREAYLNPAHTIRVEARLRHHDGAWRWSEMLIQNRLRDPAVQGIVANVRDVTFQKEAEEELTQAVLTDPLTGLPNRTLLIDRLGQTIARLERTAATAAVLFLDLDRFSVVNDSLGHEAGDRLLIAAAERLRSVLRPGDTVARFGGDEFVMLCQDLTESRDAEIVAERVAAALGDTPFVIGEDEIFLTASIGVVPILDDGATPMDLIRDADAAMYHAKERGRGRHVVFDPAMRRGTRERFEIESGLHRALEQNEFTLRYQPVVELASGSVVGVEALLRWVHPERGELGPAEFVSLAEEADLIVPIGQWALREACSQLRLWHERYGAERPLRLDVAVNLSALQLRHGDLVERVAEVLEESDVPPAALCLEITESILMEDTEASIAVLRRLKELGVVLAVDDFGTGYSSLSYLKRFPVDILKVDREFVDGLGASEEDSGIVEAVISMGHILGLRVIAEGVETPEQLEHLRRLGCDYAQGFLFSKPLMPVELDALLGSSSTPPAAGETLGPVEARGMSRAVRDRAG